ncbi:uncharacterized protein LOC133789575 [Humulus lupulus]|uniref:uncharacterized protein LOC133789575 n=1 Tax=Humulus lupulus TaxID=3486 RepID=UPI002B40E244|nr:uncharacterized protein LOC133789575 [Humulus lupulus]
MEEAVKRYLEKKEKDVDIDAMPRRLFETVNAGNILHGGATATLVDVVSTAVLYTHRASAIGVSVDMSISYLDAAYAGVEAKTLRIGKAIGVVSVELRNKNTGRIIAHARHTMYFVVSSRM